MDTLSKPIMAFSTLDEDHFEFEVMSFNLKNAPKTFQRNMVQKMHLDDISVYNNSPEERVKHLARVFECLQGSVPRACAISRKSRVY